MFESAKRNSQLSGRGCGKFLTQPLQGCESFPSVTQGGRCASTGSVTRPLHSWRSLSKPEACQKLAGGKAAGRHPRLAAVDFPTLKGWQKRNDSIFLAPFQGALSDQTFTGGIASLNTRLISCNPPGCSPLLPGWASPGHSPVCRLVSDNVGYANAAKSSPSPFLDRAVPELRDYHAFWTRAFQFVSPCFTLFHLVSLTGKKNHKRAKEGLNLDWTTRYSKGGKDDRQNRSAYFRVIPPQHPCSAYFSNFRGLDEGFRHETRTTQHLSQLRTRNSEPGTYDTFPSRECGGT